MSRILGLRKKAKGCKRKIVLPEGKDIRVLEAASFIAREQIADVYLLGKQEDVSKLAGSNNISLDGVTLIDPCSFNRKEDIINAYFELRKHKGITLQDAEKIIMDSAVFYAAMMTRLGIVEGFVAGANHKTSTVARAAIQCLNHDDAIGTVSSAFIIELDDSDFGENGFFIYGDCAIIPKPSEEQLAGIAVATSDLFQALSCIDARVAMLSYSTRGSAKSESASIILKAIKKVKEKRPSLIIDGEMQLDAAIVPEVAERKCPGSPVDGQANVLIFPSLDAGNIAYKLTQRLGNARAVGPVMTGLIEPCSDLSRGCSWEDVVDAVAVTAIRACETVNS